MAITRLYDPLEFAKFWQRIRGLCTTALSLANEAKRLELSAVKLQTLPSSLETEIQNIYDSIADIKTQINSEIDALNFTYPPLVAAFMDMDLYSFDINIDNDGATGHISANFRQATSTPFDVFDAGDFVEIEGPGMDHYNKYKRITSLPGPNTGIAFTTNWASPAADDSDAVGFRVRLRERDI